MNITKGELRQSFGSGWAYQHCVNLLERQPCNRNHLEDSMIWAREEIEALKNLIKLLDERGIYDTKSFREYVEILEILTK